MCIDYSDGLSDAILTGPAGPEQWSSDRGASRLDPLSNANKAVQLSGAAAAAVGGAEGLALLATASQTPIDFTCFLSQ